MEGELRVCRAEILRPAVREPKLLRRLGYLFVFAAVDLPV
jgi:hypothetical protein